MDSLNKKHLLAAVEESYNRQILECKAVLESKISSFNLFFMCEKKDRSGGFCVNLVFNKQSGIPEYIQDFLHRHIAELTAHKLNSLSALKQADEIAA